MKFLTRFLMMMLMITLSVSILYSQEDVLRPKGKPGGYDYTFERSPFIIGFEGGINFNMFSQKLWWNQEYYENGPPTAFDGIESGNGISPHFGVLLDIPINNNIGLQARLSYDMKNVSTTSSGFDWALFIDGAFPREIDMEVDQTSSYLTFTPLLRINATENLFFTVGPTFHFLMGKVEQTWKATVPNADADLNQFFFWDAIGMSGNSDEVIIESDTDNNFDGVEENSSFSTRVGLEAGVGYKIPISQGVYLVPQGRFQYMITKHMEDSEWIDPFFGGTIETTTDKMLHSLQFALAIWFEI